MIVGLIHAKGTSVGVATTKTQLNTAASVVMPSWARSIIKVMPYNVTDVLDADLTHMAMVNLESSDVAVTPFEMLCNPISGYDATSGQPYQPPMEKFTCNIPLKGGEEIQVWGTPAAAVTGPIYCGATLWVSDQKIGRQRFMKVGTLTGTGTTANTDVVGTAYTIHASERIVEVFGLTTDIVKAAANGCHADFRIESNDFKVAAPLEFNAEPVTGAIGTVDGPYLNGLIRHEVSVPTNTTCTLTDYLVMRLAFGAAGYFRTGVAFEKVGRN